MRRITLIDDRHSLGRERNRRFTHDFAKKSVYSICFAHPVAVDIPLFIVDFRNRRRRAGEYPSVAAPPLIPGISVTPEQASDLIDMYNNEDSPPFVSSLVWAGKPPRVLSTSIFEQAEKDVASRASSLSRHWTGRGRGYVFEPVLSEDELRRIAETSMHYRLMSRVATAKTFGDSKEQRNTASTVFDAGSYRRQVEAEGGSQDSIRAMIEYQKGAGKTIVGYMDGTPLGACKAFLQSNTAVKSFKYLNHYKQDRMPVTGTPSTSAGDYILYFRFVFVTQAGLYRENEGWVSVSKSGPGSGFKVVYSNIDGTTR